MIPLLKKASRLIIMCTKRQARVRNTLQHFRLSSTHRELPPSPHLAPHLAPHPVLPLFVSSLPRDDLALRSLVSPISPNAANSPPARTARALSTSRRRLPELGELVARRRAWRLVVERVPAGQRGIEGGRGCHREPGKWDRGGRRSQLVPHLLLPLQVPQGQAAARLGDEQARTSVKDRAHRGLRPRSHRRPGQRWRWTRG